MTQQSTTTSRRSPIRWFCAGCAVLIVGICCVCLLATSPFVLRQLGILGPDPEKMFGGAPDPAASAAVNEALIDAGIEGARAVVIPIEGGEGQIAVITLEQTTTTTGDPEEAMALALQGLTAANQEGYNIERVAVDIRDENGDPSIGITADQESVEAYTNGEITRSEFLQAVEVDLSDLLDPDQVDLLMEEVGG